MLSLSSGCGSAHGSCSLLEVAVSGGSSHDLLGLLGDPRHLLCQLIPGCLRPPLSQEVAEGTKLLQQPGKGFGYTPTDLKIPQEAILFEEVFYRLGLGVVHLQK